MTTVGTTTTDVRAEAIHRAIAFLKSTESMSDLWAKSLPLPDGAGHLLPVGEIHTGDDPLIERLAAWRCAHAAAFPTRFPVTVDGTRTWLRRNLLDVKDRLLFLVVDSHGRAVGHLGIADAVHPDGTAEVDNVVRGEAG